jgi:hypothetical protein
MSKKICYIFASRERPEKFFNCLDNIQDMSESKNYFVWAKLDNDDPKVDEYKRRLDEYKEVTVKWGLSEGKIHAINRDLDDLPDCDIIVVMSDDMVWEVFGFDDEIRNAFEKYFPNLDGLVHFPDSHAGERTVTLTIMGINLYKKLGYLYHPSYQSVYADNDLTEMTKAMGKYVFINKRIFDHYHPIWGMCDWDQQYRKTEDAKYYQQDRQTFLDRGLINFGL